MEKTFRFALVFFGLVFFVGCGSNNSDSPVTPPPSAPTPEQPAEPDPTAPTTGTTCTVPEPGIAKDFIVYHKGTQGAGTAFQAGVVYIGTVIAVHEDVAVKVNFNGVGEQIVAISSVLPQAFCAPDAIVGRNVVLRTNFRSGTILRVFASGVAEVDWSDSASNTVEKLSDLALANP